MSDTHASSHAWSAAPGIGTAVLDAFVYHCIKNSEYDFAHGGHGSDYVDIDAIEAWPTKSSPVDEIPDRLVDAIRSLCEGHGYNTLAFIDSSRGPGGIVAARVFLARTLGLPTLILRPDRRLLGLAMKPFGLPREARVLIVTDVATTGRSIADAAKILAKVGVTEMGAIAVADRGEGAQYYLESRGIPLTSLFQHRQTDRL